MNDAYIQIAIVTAIGLIAFMAKMILQDIKALVSNGLRDLSKAIRDLSQGLQAARSEFAARLDSQNSAVQIAISDLDRRLSTMEGRCNNEHGESHRRAGDDEAMIIRHTRSIR
jgi:hypothetical protein